MVDEIKKNERRLRDGTVIPTYSTEIVSANILEVEVGTTGYKGGDGGHGGRTYFRIHDLSSTDIRAWADYYSGFEVTLGGDSELDTMIEALKFIVDVLEKNKGEVPDCE